MIDPRDIDDFYRCYYVQEFSKATQRALHLGQLYKTHSGTVDAEAKARATLHPLRFDFNTGHELFRDYNTGRRQGLEDRLRNLARDSAKAKIAEECKDGGPEAYALQLGAKRNEAELAKAEEEHRAAYAREQYLQRKRIRFREELACCQDRLKACEESQKDEYSRRVQSLKRDTHRARRRHEKAIDKRLELSDQVQRLKPRVKEMRSIPEPRCGELDNAIIMERRPRGCETPEQSKKY